MARQIAVINKFLEDALVATAATVGISITPSNWSVYDYKKLVLNAIAQGFGIMEQIFDAHENEIENILGVLPPNNRLWMQNQMLNVFQYDATNVQVLKFNESNFTPYYINNNQIYKVVKYASVVPGVFGTTLVKIAGITAGVPSQLSSQVVSAAQSFIDQIGVPGIKYDVVSRKSDKLYLVADVYYDGIFSSIIRQSVKDAISNYLKSIKFDGKISYTDILAAIKSVQGVNDVFIHELWARDDSNSVANGFKLIQSDLELNKEYQTYAGYIIPETTTDYKLDDLRQGSSIQNLQMIAQ